MELKIFPPGYNLHHSFLKLDKNGWETTFSSCENANLEPWASRKKTLKPSLSIVDRLIKPERPSAQFSTIPPYEDKTRILSES